MNIYSHSYPDYWRWPGTTRPTTKRVETIEYDDQGRVIKRTVTETTERPGGWTYTVTN